MLKVFASLVVMVAAILLVGIWQVTLGGVALIVTWPLVFLYKLLGNRPGFLIYVGFLAGFLGGLAFIWGYIFVPIQYYYSLWGWGGVFVGVLATILLPFQLFLFFGVALFKGGAAIYIGNFLSDVLFGISGLLLYMSIFSASPWERFRLRNSPE